MDKRIKGMFAALCSLGVALLGAGPSWSAVGETPPLPASATLQELEQIVINGRRIEERILDSERRFYERYNALNAVTDFDVDCTAEVRDERAGGDRAARYRQACLPLFVAAVAQRSGSASCGGGYTQYIGADAFDNATWGGPSGSYTYGGWIGRTPAGWGPLGRGGSSVAATAGSCTTRASVQPRLVWMNRRTAFEENLDKVMNADAQLQGLGREFQSLMQENRDALAVAAEARRQQLVLRKAAQTCPPPTSPRVTARSCRTD